ncbi:MAG TPA: hypothetical protein VLJ38_18855, partial [Polyangiaceae bacterium]|nr:hypothetical protein [Polyangiaceae bacterium]
VHAFTLGRCAALSGAAVLLTITLTWTLRRRTGAVAASSRPNAALTRDGWNVTIAAALLCTGFGVLYAAYPTYFLLGGQDPGPYLAFAARIARTGGLNLAAPAIEAWSHAHPGLMRGLPAVYGNLTDQHGGQALEAQFLHLFTAFDATFFALDAIEGAVRANAWLAVLCLATGFSLLRRIGTTPMAFAYVLALGVNPAFIWASRITLSEMLALWLNLSSLLLLALAWDRRAVGLGMLAGVVSALGLLNRLDGGIGVFALIGFSLAALVGTREHRRVAACAAVAHFVFSLIGYEQAYALSPIYCRSITRGSHTAAIPFVTLSLDVLAFGLALAPKRLQNKLRLNERSLRLGGYAGVVLAFLWLGFGLWLRPHVDQSDDAPAMRELGWYVGAATWPFVIGGLSLALSAARLRRWLPLWAFSLATFLLYTARTDVAPVHIWASRRWVEHVIPLTLACAVLGVTWVVERMRGRWSTVATAAALAVTCLGPPLAFDRPFLFHSMLKGLPKAYSRVAAYARAHPEQWPLVTHHVHFGSILTYIYEIPTVVLDSETGIPAFERGELTGELAVGFTAFERRQSAPDPSGYVGVYLEPSKDHRPSELIEQRFPLEIGEIGGRTFDAEMPAWHPAFRRQVSFTAPNGSVVSNGQRGQLLYGPWITLTPGRYRVEWYGRLDAAPKNKPQGALDVIYDEGRHTVAAMPLALPSPTRGNDVLGELEFTLNTRLEGIEFRVRVEPRVRLILTKVRLQCFGTP